MKAGPQPSEAEAGPWMGRAELAVLERLLARGDAVLEFGAGGSTLWLAERVREVHSVEHDPAWAEKIRAAAPPNVTLHLRLPAFPSPAGTPAAPGQYADYTRAPEVLGRVFDACLVDGRARIECAVAAARWLKPDGWLFFHDWFPRPRYTSRLGELLPFYQLCEERCARGAGQTLAVFRRLPDGDPPA